MYGTEVTITGNLGADPEMGWTTGGVARCTLRVAVTSRQKVDGQWQDGNTTWYRVTAWRDLADHCGNSLTKGTRVMVKGQLENREYTGTDGQQHMSLEVQADEVAVSLLRAEVKVSRAERSRPAAPPADDMWQTAPAASSSGDPWASDPADDTPPF